MCVHKQVIVRLKGTFRFVDSVHTAEAANSRLFHSWSWPLVVGSALQSEQLVSGSRTGKGVCLVHHHLCTHCKRMTHWQQQGIHSCSALSATVWRDALNSRHFFLSLCLPLSLSLCSSGAVSTLCFVWKLSCITFHSLIHAYMFINNGCNFISIH